jgi:SNF2 family DNA or RNA helicase
MSTPPVEIEIDYHPETLRGRFEILTAENSSIWDRMTQRLVATESDYEIAPRVLVMPWATALGLMREFASVQRREGFRFKPTDAAKSRIDQFAREYKTVQRSRDKLSVNLSGDEIALKLRNAGFTRRELKQFQLRDLAHLLSLPNGANFSVPGAGKTTVALALNVLTKSAGQHLLVVGPKNAFMAWQDAVEDCIQTDAPNNNAEKFTVLAGGTDTIASALQSGTTRFLITYDQLIRIPTIIASYLARQAVHLVLDESHRMKAGLASQRGSLLLNLASLPIRRDILSGTPMPQGPSDLQSQLDFLWPGAGLGLRIMRGATPRQVLGSLYVRTTKSELGLPKPIRHYINVNMNAGQQALYAIARSEVLKQLSTLKSERRIDLHAARRSVLRLLQLSANPVLALRAMAESNDVSIVSSGIVDAVVDEGPSQKMREVATLARELARTGRKSVIWTIFTGTLLEMEQLVSDLNPVTIYGAIPTGDDSTLETREGRIRRFHEDPACSVLIANPAAAGEGISLHEICHDAIYLDRSYNTTHYLQSIDRIHRLGLSPETETNIFVFQTVAPKGIGSIDRSVNRRLATKLRNMQQLLNDPDLHELALDEENAADPTDYGIEFDDLIDLIEELEGRSGSEAFEEE